MNTSAPNFVNARQQYAELVAALEALSPRINAAIEQKGVAQAQLATLEAAYAAACKDVASGKPANPDAILAQQTTLRHTLLGLDQIIANLNAEALPYQQRIPEVSRLVAILEETEEFDRLNEAHSEVASDLKEKEAAYSTAYKVFTASVAKISAHSAKTANRKMWEQRERLRNAPPAA
jgi:hypothetical protein